MLEHQLERQARRHLRKLRRMSQRRRVAYMRSLPDELRYRVAALVAGGDS